MTVGRRASAADLAAVLVSYGNAPALRQTLESVVRCEVGEVVVWDNTEEDVDRELVRSVARSHATVYGGQENVGFGRGNNAAVRHVSKPYVLMVNPDCRVNPNALVSMLDLLSTAPHVGAVAPRMLYPDGRTGTAGGNRPSLVKEVAAMTDLEDRLPKRVRQVAMRMAEYLIFRRSDGSLVASRESGEPIDVDWASGFCLLMRTDDFRSVGGFRDEFFLYFEDVDLCDRIRARGQRVVVDRRVAVEHTESATTGPNKRAFYWAGLATYWSLRGKTLHAWIARRLSAWFRRGATATKGVS